MSDHYKYGYICTWCGKVAFFTNVMPEKGQRILSQNFIKPDGTKPMPNSNIICTQCHEPIVTMYVENIVELGKFRPGLLEV